MHLAAGVFNEDSVDAQAGIFFVESADHITHCDGAHVGAVLEGGWREYAVGNFVEHHSLTAEFAKSVGMLSRMSAHEVLLALVGLGSVDHLVASYFLHGLDHVLQGRV